MEVLDQLAVDHHDALAGGRRLGVGGDDLVRPRDLLGRGREDLVGLGDGLGVDQGLAVEAELLALAALRGKALRSEEHTSELQSLMRISYAVFCLKKKKP